LHHNISSCLKSVMTGVTRTSEPGFDPDQMSQ
jgi:hypothetical protein